MVNSVFAVLLTQLKHRRLAYRNSNQTDQDCVPSTLNFETKDLTDQPAHRHISIREENSLPLDINGTDSSSSHGLDLCVRWAAGTSDSINQTQKLGASLRKTYICATLFGPKGTTLCGRRSRRVFSPKNHHRDSGRLRNRALHTQNKSGYHNVRSCHLCQAAIRTAQRKILMAENLSTKSAKNTSLACHSSGSSSVSESWFPDEYEQCQATPERLRRSQSHCDKPALRLNSAHRLQRRQVVSGEFHWSPNRQFSENISVVNVGEMKTSATFNFDHAAELAQFNQPVLDNSICYLRPPSLDKILQASKEDTQDKNP